MRGKIITTLLPLVAYGVYLGSGIAFLIFYPEIGENQWYQIISSWVGFGLSLFLIIGGIISFSTIFPIVKEPITLFRKIFNIAIAIGYALLLFWLAFTLGKIYEIPMQSPSTSAIVTEAITSEEPECDNHEDIQEFEKQIPIIWTAKFGGCLASCRGASFTRVPSDVKVKYPHFAGYYSDGQNIPDQFLKDGLILKIYGNWTGVDFAYSRTVFENKCVPAVDIEKIEVAESLTSPLEAYPDISTKDWNTYHNTRFEYTVKYPSNWTLGEPPVNGDGISLYDDGDSKVVVYGSLMGPEFPNDFINGREILFQEQLDLAGGEKGKFLLINAGNSRSEYIMFVEHPDQSERYVVFASVPNDFLENNQGVLDAIMKSFVKL